MRCLKCGYKLNPKESEWCGICGTKLISRRSLKRLPKSNLSLFLFRLCPVLVFLMKFYTFVIFPFITLIVLSFTLFGSSSEIAVEQSQESTHLALTSLNSKFKGIRTAYIERDGKIWKVYYYIWDPSTDKNKSDLIVRYSARQARRDVKTWVNFGYIRVK